MNTLYSQLEAKQDEILAIKGSRGEVAFKAAGNILAANFTNKTTTAIDPQLIGYTPIADVQARNVIDYFPKVMCNSHSLYILNEEADDDDGTFGTVAEGAAKEQIDFDINAAQKSFTKYAAHVKVSEEMLDDLGFLQARIEGVLMRRIKNKIATDFLAAVIAATPGTVDTDLTAGQLVTKHRHVLQAIYEGVLNRKGYMINLWALNAPDYGKVFNDVDASVDTAWLDMYKPLILPSTAVATGKILGVDTSMFPIYIYKDVNMSIGRTSDDFTKNMVTIRGEARVAWNVAGECLNAFFYDTIADVITQA